jgi:hypothetical protein
MNPEEEKKETHQRKKNLPYPPKYGMHGRFNSPVPISI